VGKRVEGCAGPAASPTVGFIVGVLPELAVAQPPIDTGFAIEFAARATSRAPRRGARGQRGDRGAAHLWSTRASAPKPRPAT